MSIIEVYNCGPEAVNIQAGCMVVVVDGSYNN